MSIFSIGLSGLEAARAAFNTTSNNVSNVATPGYDNEVAQLSTQSGDNGVKVDGVQRQFNRFITGELNDSQSAGSSLSAYQSQISQIDNLFSSSTSSLTTGLQGFFSAVSQYVQSPSNSSARQGVIGKANTLAAQFQSTGRALDQMRSSVNGQISDDVATINTMAQQIAKLNQQITVSKGRSSQAPNSLLDQRDELVSKLSQQVGIHTLQQSNGDYDVSIGNGQQLVAGNKAFQLDAVPSPANPQETVVGYTDAAGNAVALPDSDITGGDLGGLLQFRDQSLDPIQGQLGALAVGFSEAVNQVQASGVTPDGKAGTAMFSTGTPAVTPDAHNTGTATMSAAYDPANVQSLTGDDYTLRYHAGTGQFDVTNVETGAHTTATLGNGGTISLAGVTLTVNDPADLADGDQFELDSTRQGASDFQSQLQSPSELAAASPGGGSGNNKAALALENLQNQAIIGGSSTPSQAYATLVSMVGNQTSSVSTELTSQQAITQQLTQSQQSVSGVDLDQEAANLMLDQQYYAANTKVIAAGQTILNAILALEP